MNPDKCRIQYYLAYYCSMHYILLQFEFVCHKNRGRRKLPAIIYCFHLPETWRYHSIRRYVSEVFHWMCLSEDQKQIDHRHRSRLKSHLHIHKKRIWDWNAVYHSCHSEHLHSVFFRSVRLRNRNLRVCRWSDSLLWRDGYVSRCLLIWRVLCRIAWKPRFFFLINSVPDNSLFRTIHLLGIVI